MPKVGAFPLMTKYDNERDPVVPDLASVLRSCWPLAARAMPFITVVAKAIWLR